MKINVIIPGAGEGKRMKAGDHKPYLMLQGRSVVEHTVSLFDRMAAIDEIFLAVHPDKVTSCREYFAGTGNFSHDIRIISGGVRRQDSVYNAVRELPVDTDIVLVHDGVRPLVKRELVEAVIESAAAFGAAVPGLQLGDTIKEVTSAREVVSTVKRECVWSIQTPQGFRYEWLQEGYRLCEEKGMHITDDAMAVEAAGHTVRVIEGDRENIKLTTKLDLVLAEAILKNRNSPEVSDAYRNGI